MFADAGLGIVVAIIAAKIFGIELTSQLIGMSVLFTLLPDIDFLVHVILRRTMDGKDAHTHRDLFHYPLIYCAIGGLVAGVFGWVWLFIFMAASLAHFMHDSIGIGWGVKWLGPFLKKNFALYQADTQAWFFWKSDREVKELAETYGKDEWVKYYYLGWHPIGMIENAIFIASLVALWIAMR